MQGERRTRARALAVLAAAQHGVATYRQLIACGLTRGAIEYWVRIGHLHPLHRGVFAVGHAGISRNGELIAAVLAYGDGAVMSHWSAAELWGLTASRRALIHVSAPSSHRTRKGTVFHQVITLSSADCARRDGIPVTSPTRTLFDMASVAAPKRFGRMLDEAERSGWFNRRATRELIQRSPGRKGVRALRQAWRARDPGIRWTRSDLEASFRRLCRAHGIPLPLFNVRVEGFLVDCLWPSAGLIVELDGYEFHRTRSAFERDRRRDARLKLAGYTVIRIGYEWLARAPDEVAATVARLLAPRS